MQELVVLCNFGPFTLTAYGLCVLAGAALGVAMTLLRGRKSLGMDASLSLCLSLVFSAWAGARVVYVLTQLEGILVDAEYYGLPFILHPWEGGYTLYGAVLGAALGIWLYGRVTRRSPGKLADVAAPGAVLALCVIRLGDYFTGQGLGHYVEEEALQRFPFAVQNLYEDWQQPVFLFEALAALVICLVLLGSREARRPGALGERLLLLLGATQIFLESHREDECIRFGFVRFTQVAAIVIIAAVFAYRLVLRVRSHGWSGGTVARMVVFVLMIALCVGIEFALDKSSINNHLLYAVMAAGLAVLTAAAWIPENQLSGAVKEA